MTLDYASCCRYIKTAGGFCGHLPLKLFIHSPRIASSPAFRKKMSTFPPRSYFHTHPFIHFLLSPFDCSFTHFLHTLLNPLFHLSFFVPIYFQTYTHRQAYQINSLFLLCTVFLLLCVGSVFFVYSCWCVFVDAGVCMFASSCFQCVLVILVILGTWPGFLRLGGNTYSLRC